MAWTNPKTWSFGEVLTSTDMNTYVRDNTEFLFDRVVAGIGSNVVQTVLTTPHSTTSTSFTDVTNLSVTITPSKNTSKVLIIGTWTGGMSGTFTGRWRLVRGSTAIGVSSGGGDATANVFSSGGSIALHFLDSPGVTTATTYKIQALATSGTIYTGRLGNNDERSIVALTAIEVEA